MCCAWEITKDIATTGASIAAILGIIGAWRTYWSNNSIRKVELINKLYAKFLTDEWYTFYEIVKNSKEINLKANNNEKRLNETLSLFDEIEYYYSLKLLDEKSLVYFAAEIFNFSENETVMKYVKDTETRYKEKNFAPDIIPFSGFTELLKKINENKKTMKLKPRNT
jgi:hypothetical protein